MSNVVELNATFYGELPVERVLNSAGELGLVTPLIAANPG